MCQIYFPAEMRGTKAAGMLGNWQGHSVHAARPNPNKDCRIVTKQELIQRLAERANVGKVETLLVVDALEQLIREELAAGGEIPLARTGKFRLREQAARMGRNPKTGESVMIPARRKIVFTPAKALKDAVG